jgi:hypothetical protein
LLEISFSYLLPLLELASKGFAFKILKVGTDFLTWENNGVSLQLQHL